MDTKTIAIVTLSIVVADRVRVSYRNQKRIAKLTKTNQSLINYSKKLQEYSMYLADKLDKNNIPIDDFDQIVIDDM